MKFLLNWFAVMMVSAIVILLMVGIIILMGKLFVWLWGCPIWLGALIGFLVGTAIITWQNLDEFPDEIDSGYY